QTAGCESAGAAASSPFAAAATRRRTDAPPAATYQIPGWPASSRPQNIVPAPPHRLPRSGPTAPPAGRLQALFLLLPAAAARLGCSAAPSGKNFPDGQALQ